MTAISKTRVLIVLNTLSRNWAVFGDDGESETPREELHMPFGKWEEMGRPTEITVTVEPGDKLNA